MGKLGTFTRRSFLIGSAAIAGGVAFGVYAYRRPVENPLLENLADGEAAITPYVKIDANGITLITPRADKGQGAYSMQANLIAEELDVDPLKVNVDPGMPGPAYYNSAVMEESAPFPSYDESWIAQHVRDVMHAPPKFLGMQITGGSSTTPDAFERLREAGAVARETLKEAAAMRTGNSRDQLNTQDGHVILPGGEKIAYTELAAEAAKLTPVSDVPLRSPEQWKLLGKKVDRLDMVRKCTGTEVYGIDLEMEGMVFASVRANPGIGGKVESFDAAKATSMRGVQKIVPVESGVGVIADNTWHAIQAVNAIDIKWGDGPYPASSAKMWEQLETTISDDTYDSRNRDDGDVDAALSNGETIEAEYRVPYLAHAPMEPMNAVVRVTDDMCEIWTGTQVPRFLQAEAARITGLAVENILVYVQPMGGSFGRRLEFAYVMQTVELAMAVKGTPVKMTWSREEDMTHDYPRPIQLSRARGKVSAGKVDTYDLSIASASVTSSWFGRVWQAPPGPDATIVAGAWDQPFAIPNYRVTGYRAPEMVPISTWRSVGASGNGFLHDGFLDELIHAAGADPLAERIRLCMHDTSRKVLEAVGEMSGWDGHKIGENRGRGVAFTTSFGVPTAQVVEVTQTDRGIKIDKVFCAVDVGTVIDPVNIEAQVFGGIVWGLGHAMNCELTYENFSAQQTNYHQFEGMRLYQCPPIEVKALSNGSQIRGIGEPGVPPAAPALANAIFAATGKRIRELPLNKQIDFI